MKIVKIENNKWILVDTVLGMAIAGGTYKQLVTLQKTLDEENNFNNDCWNIQEQPVYC